MSKSVLQWMETYIRRAFRSRAWKKFMQMMVCVVVFCTTYALILPALTMEHRYACGVEEHLHGESCYENRTQIALTCTPESLGLHIHSDSCGGGSLCGYRANPLHTHEEICYDAAGGLICPLEDLAEHTHSDGCYEAGPLVCTLAEIQGHAHSEDCYEAGPMTCFLEESQAHAHEQACYDENGALICPLEETPGHTHDSACHGPVVLTCTLEEQAGHTHEAACFGPAVLTCTREVVQLHTHSETCLDDSGTFACGLLQTAAHRHDESCVKVISEEKILICTVEEHVHASNCNSDPEADVESREQWAAGLSQVTLTGQWADDLLAVARSQLGYQESQLNILMENGARKGYTRYGHWFGITYADWDAMFVSFCVHYAGIPEEAIAGSAYSDRWLEELQTLELTASLDDRSPVPGEIVFFRAEDESIRCGVIHAVDTELDDTGVSRIAQLRVIAGNVDNRVTEISVASDKVVTVVGMEQVSARYEAILAETPSEVPTEPAVTLTQQAETENYIVTVAYSSDLVLPEGAELRVSEYARDSDIFRQRCEEAGYELEWLLNIGFYVEETELELDGAFDVRVTSKQGDALGQDITHFADEGTEQLDAVSVEEDGQTSVLFSADGFSDFGGGVAPAAEVPVAYAEALSYTFKTADPGQLREGVDYAIYIHSGGTQTFLGSGLNAIRVDTNKWTSPTTIGSTWDVGTGTLGTDIGAFTWRIQKLSDGTYRLYSPQKNQYLHVDWNSVKLTNDTSKQYKNDSISGAASILHHPWGDDGSFLRYSNGWTGTTSRGSATTVYFAEVTAAYPYTNYPHAVHTGDVAITRLRFLNFRGDGDKGVNALAGCTFRVVSDAKNADGTPVYETTLVSGSDPIVELPADIPVGSYTITEISAAAGYIRDDNPTRQFTVQELNGEKLFVTNKSIGIFVNHPKEEMDAHKTAEVENYEERIYQVLLDAASNLRKYEMDPVDIRLVVDQSNSMLFPSGLTPVAGKTVVLGKNDGENDTRLEALNLDKSRMHYIISDPAGTSTVWCIWHDGTTWMYQDASYYAKAKHGNVTGYETPDEQAIFPTNDTYSNQPTTATDPRFSKARSNGGAVDKDMTGSGLGTYIDGFANDRQTFQIYTSTTEFNRLHYLEEALGYLIVELADANPKNRVSLTLFTKVVDHEHCVPSTELTPDAVTLLLDTVDSINTSGGTRQDIALAHVYDEPKHEPMAGYDSYTVLITDGAPVTSGEQKSLGDAYADNNINEDSTEVYPRIRGEAWNIRVNEGSTLMTVALGMGDVAGGAHVLQNIASPGYSFAYSDAANLTEALQELIYRAFTMREEIPMQADLVDEISDSFYPIAWVSAGSGDSTGRQVLVRNDGGKDWILLQPGDWIDLEGMYTTGTDKAGQLFRRDDGTFCIRWENLTLADANAGRVQQIAWVSAGSGSSSGRTVIGTDGTRDWILLNEGDWISSQGEFQKSAPSWRNQRYYGKYSSGSISWGYSADPSQRILYGTKDKWNGTFYLKAKEDFIGGNAIDTNKNAYLTYVDEQTQEYHFSTPTVNVRLLDMNELHSEVTVYKGDTINETGHSPMDSLTGFYEDTFFTKLIVDGSDVLNRIESSASETDGLEDAVFYLRYAMGRDLTADEWKTLAAGGTVTVPYTYDNPSSHGPVGYFTFTMTREGATADYEVHTATEACQPGGTPSSADCTAPAETYTLNIAYTAYRLGESGRPGVNVHNGTGSPGTEVGGSEAGTTVETGLGILDKENIHEVHVISGRIIIHKRFDGTYTADKDLTFTFTLHRVEDGEYTTADMTGTITIPAGSNTGSASITFDDLRRGTYTVTEAVNQEYTVKEITVIDSTNCYSTPAIGASATELTFVMGNNVANANVIGKAEGAAYTSYVDPVNGVLGEAVFTNREIVFEGDIPVIKRWSDGTEEHPDDTVYLLLYKDDVPVLDDQGRARILRLDDTNDWTDKFTVTLANKDDKVTNYNYSVREVKQASTAGFDGAAVAVLENDGTTLIYYSGPLTQDRAVAFGERSYIVQYEAGENGAWTVTNIRAVELPMTGGLGTHQYTISGMLLIAAALVFGFSQRRKRERRGS